MAVTVPLTPASSLDQKIKPTSAYRYYVLTLLVAVYALNFIDRQILSVLAVDLKHDLGLSDADLGFLYGTAFGVFYALFGIPMGRLADSWNRVRLITVDLTLWSAMTALSGLSRTGGQLAAARVGVGIGEATASPCAYSLLSDFFPRERRATALAIYSTGMYLGAGLSLFAGGLVVQHWNAAYPNGWLGLVGWQAAFLAVGLPGILLAAVIATLREPPRGMSDGLITPPSPYPFHAFFAELMIVLPPLTFIGAARRGRGALLVNLVAALTIAGTALILTVATGDALQWTAVAVGTYAVFSWASALRTRDPPAFALIWGTPAFLLMLAAQGLQSVVNYAVSFWSLPYVETAFSASKAEAGLLIGGAGAAGGFLGLILGARASDRLKLRHPAGRVMVMLFAATAAVPLKIVSFTTSSLVVFYALHLPMILLSSCALGAYAATSQDLVLPRMRGLATATLFLAITMIGLALGPYAAGRLATVFDGVGGGVLALVSVVPLTVIALALLFRVLPTAEATVIERARSAGEPI
ncbi:MFS transporter [Sphingomonas sp. RHCKR47]|uniref:spinster family MFS transporter n=1 Tax=Sphingomonas citricola TaxID=2862498 RepID=UPI001C67390C|nr:MFS transporter [Sphingomonas citricola]